MKVQPERPIFVRVDGPYGDLGWNEAQHPVAIIVAGGIGITPAIGLLRHLYGIDGERHSAPPGPRGCVYVLWSVAEEVRRRYARH